MPKLKPAGVIVDQTLVNQLDSSLNESGLYFHPTYEEPMEPGSGSMAIVYYTKTIPAMGNMMGMGFVQMLVSSLLASLFVSKLALSTFAHRLGVASFLGVFVAVWADVGNMIWWRHPLDWTAFHFGYDVFSWVLAGLVIAALVKPPQVG